MVIREVVEAAVVVSEVVEAVIPSMNHQKSRRMICHLLIAVRVRQLNNWSHSPKLHLLFVIKDNRRVLVQFRLHSRDRQPRQNRELNYLQPQSTPRAEHTGVKATNTARMPI